MNEPAQRAIEPTPPAAPSPADEARRLFELANQRQRAGDGPGAIELYTRLLERFPAIPDAYNNLAILHKAAKRLPAAIACLRRALNLAPQSSALHSNLGNMLWMAIEFDDAMTAFRRALELDPSRPEIYHNLGLLYFSLGNYQSAVECFDRALALQPGGTHGDVGPRARAAGGRRLRARLRGL